MPFVLYRPFSCFKKMKVWMFVYLPCMYKSMVLIAHYQIEGTFILHISIRSSTSGLKPNLQVGKLSEPLCTMRFWYEKCKYWADYVTFLNTCWTEIILIWFSLVDWLFGLLQENRICKLLHMGLPIYKARWLCFVLSSHVTKNAQVWQASELVSIFNTIFMI